MTIKTTQEGSAAVITVEGRIDTNTSFELQAALLSAFQTAKAVTVDFASVSYISSAGLRALLIGQKTAASKGFTMALTNVSPAVYSILESVGFAKILTIE